MSDEQGSQDPDDQSQYGGPGAPTPVAALEVSGNSRHHDQFSCVKAYNRAMAYRTETSKR